MIDRELVIRKLVLIAENLPAVGVVRSTMGKFLGKDGRSRFARHPWAAPISPGSCYTRPWDSPKMSRSSHFEDALPALLSGSGWHGRVARLGTAYASSGAEGANAPPRDSTGNL